MEKKEKNHQESQIKESHQERSQLKENHQESQIKERKWLVVSRFLQMLLR